MTVGGIEAGRRDERVLTALLIDSTTSSADLAGGAEIRAFFDGEVGDRSVRIKPAVPPSESEISFESYSACLFKA
jgi:hypothetical protein